MNGLIVFNSNYGSTRRYAETLSEKTGWPALDMKKAGKQDLGNAGVLVLASNIRIGKMGIRKWAAKHQPRIRGKEIIILAVGGNPSDELEYYCDIGMKNLGFLGIKREQIFGLGGRKIRAKLKGMDAFLFNMLEKISKDNKEREDILRDVDYVNLKDLDKIMAYIENKKFISKGIE